MATCHGCGQYIAESSIVSSLDDLPLWINVAAGAASGGEMKPFHGRCAPGGPDVYSFVSQAECKRREAEAAQRARAELLEMPLPCDVRLPPATIIRKGCPLSTLLIGLERRKPDAPPA